MTKTLAEAAASCTAYGISNAASANRTSVRVMWVLLFLLLLGLFLKSGLEPVEKLRYRRLIKEFHSEKAQFVFPDLYFCPRNPYSGSYPYSLKKSEADLINAEISRIQSKISELRSAVLAKYKDISGINMHGFHPHSWEILQIVQASLPFTFIANYLVQRIEQSILFSVVYSNSQINSKDWVYVIPFYLPENLLCFKLNFAPDQKRLLQLVNTTLEVWLSTDPFFSEVNFTGYPINPITDADNNSIPFKNWHPIYNTEYMKQSGYNMLIVPPGTYPSLEFETDFRIGPGSEYSVDLEMFENTFSEELHGTYCVANPPEVDFENPLTGERETFNYSSAVCYMQRRLRSAINSIGCRFSNYPLLWEHKSTPRCHNITEMTPVIYDYNFMNRVPTETTDYATETDAYCKIRNPCRYPKYSAISSVGKWPSVSRSTAEDLTATNAAYYHKEKATPGFTKIRTIAQEILNGSHSPHLEGLFRMYMSESWLKVRISAASAMSDQGVTTWSYSLTDFLADIGGLMGLYIGCSLMTLFELLELLYILIEYACKRRSQTKDTTSKAEAAAEHNPNDVASAANAEQKC